MSAGDFLLAAVSRGDSNACKTLIDQCIIDQNQYDLEMALDLACYMGNEQIVTLLLTHGGVPAHCRDNQPLMSACANGHVNIAKLLLNNGAVITDNVKYMAKHFGTYESFVRKVTNA